MDIVQILTQAGFTDIVTSDLGSVAATYSGRRYYDIQAVRVDNSMTGDAVQSAPAAFQIPLEIRCAFTLRYGHHVVL